MSDTTKEEPTNNSAKCFFSTTKGKLVVVGAIVLIMLGIIISQVVKPKKQRKTQLWKLNDCSKLENGFGPSWEFKDKIWSLPSEGEAGFIREKSTGQVLTIEGNKVVLKKELYNSTDDQNQKWVKSAPKEGMFTLKNPSSNKFLTKSIPEDKQEVDRFGIDDGTSTVIEDEKDATKCEDMSVQKWRLINETYLENKGASYWEFEDEEWSLPSEEGIEDYIAVKSEGQTGQFLTVDGSKIKLQKKAVSDENQKWVKSALDSENWFTLKNPNSNKFLTNVPEDKSDSTTVVEEFLKMPKSESNTVTGGASAGSSGSRSCYGKANTKPTLRPKDQVTQFTKFGLGYLSVFKFPVNGNRNRRSAKTITFEGSCCWVIFGRDKGSTIEHQMDINIPENGEYTPAHPYITFMKTKKC